MATNIISHWTVYAAYTMEEWRLEGPLNINYLGIFLHFPNHYIKWDQKSLGEQGKVENSAKWVTLVLIARFDFNTYQVQMDNWTLPA